MIDRSGTTSKQDLNRWAILLPAVMVIAAAACGGGDPQLRPQAKGPAAVRIGTASVQRISIQRQVELAGTLISPDQARVSSEVSGRVREVMVELGQEVKPGQAIVQLDPSELELALRQADGQLRQTEAQLGMDGSPKAEPPPDEQISTIRTAIANRDEARAQAERATMLIKRGLLAQADYDTAQTRVKVTEAAYQAAIETVRSLKATLHQRRAAHELAQKKLKDAVIRAPIGGSVAERLVQPGEFIRENSPVVTIVQMNPLKLRTAVQERHASLMKPGLRVEFWVESIPTEIFPGRLAFISPAVDQATRTFPVEIMVDNSDRRLKPGFFAKGNIMTQMDENVLAVPDSTVSTLAGESSVFVVERNKVRKQTVRLGAMVENLVEIVTGIKGDEILAATHLNELADGVVVSTGGAADSDAEPGAEPPARSGRGKKGGRQ